MLVVINFAWSRSIHSDGKLNDVLRTHNMDEETQHGCGMSQLSLTAST